MRFSYRLILSLIVALPAISLVFATYQAGAEMQALKDDVQLHALELAEGQQRSAEARLERGSQPELQALVDRFQNHERLCGVAVFDAHGQPVAATAGLASRVLSPPSTILKALRQGKGE